MAFNPLTFPTDDHRAAPPRWFSVREGKVLVADAPLVDGVAHFLGDLDGCSCWAEEVPESEPDESRRGRVHGLGAHSNRAQP